MGAASHFRHPELVPGSIFPSAWIKRRQTEADRQINPFRISGIDEIDLPLPMPVLELLFTGDGALHVTKTLEVDEALNLVTAGEAGGLAVSMLPQARNQVRCDANIKCAVKPAGQNVDAGEPLVLHKQTSAETWTLKQVQGDGGVMI